jgi:Predicted membrane protein (DUF2339)
MNADSAETYARLAAELRRLGQRLNGIGDELERLQAGAAGRAPLNGSLPGSGAGSTGGASATAPVGPTSSHPGSPDAGGPYAGGPYPGGSYAGAPYPGFPDAGGPYAGSPNPGAPYPGFPDAGAPYAGGSYAGAPYPGSPDAGAPYPGFPDAGAPYPGDQYPRAQQPGVPVTGFPPTGGQFPGAQNPAAGYAHEPHPPVPHPAGYPAPGPGPFPGRSFPGGPVSGSPVSGGGPAMGGPAPGGPPFGWPQQAPGGLRRSPAAGPPGPSLPPLFRPLTQLSGARLLAWAGGAVTLVGVVLLLVLAASRGWFSPPARVGAGAVLGVVLVGLGARLHRKESARPGAVALVATGFATLYLVVVAATAIYDYLDTIPALLLALLVAGGGLGLADRWRSQLLGGGVVLGAALLAPFLSTDWRLVAMVLALQLAALPVLLRRRWPVLMLLAAGGPVLYGTVIGLVDGEATGPGTVAVVLGVLAVGLGTALLAGGALPSKPVAVLVAATPVPVIAAGSALGGWGGAALAAAAALALGLLAVRPATDRLIRLVAAIGAAVAVFQATVIALDGATLTGVVLGEALVAAVLAGSFRARLPLVVSMAYGVFGVSMALVQDAPLAALIQFPEYPYQGRGMASALLTGAGVSVLVLGLAVLVLVATGRVGWVRPDAQSAGLWVPIGLVGLYGATSLMVTLALLVAPDRTGFTAGHALVTVSWTVVALGLLARGISRPALRVTGLVLVAAAVAKLVLFDLVALDGIPRVAAFLGAGLILLAAGTRYARMVAEATAVTPATAPGPTTPPPSAGLSAAVPAAPTPAAPSAVTPAAAAAATPAATPAAAASPPEHHRPGPSDVRSWGPSDPRTGGSPEPGSTSSPAQRPSDQH